MHNDSSIRQLVSYDPETGWFTRLRGASQFSRVHVGARADRRKHDGYRSVYVAGRDYLAHRLAWFLMTGTWPSDEVDHINGIKDDNRWANLRNVTRALNAQNQRRCQSDNRSSGFLGVSILRTGKAQATIHMDGRNRYLGLYETAEAAHAAYVAAKRELHPGCTL